MPLAGQKSSGICCVTLIRGGQPGLDRGGLLRDRPDPMVDGIAILQPVVGGPADTPLMRVVASAGSGGHTRETSTTPATKPAAQCGQCSGSRSRPPEARIFRVVAKFLMSESQLRIELWAAARAGKLMKALQSCSAPLEGVAQTCGTGSTRPEAALDPGMFGQGLDLKPLISGRRKPP
jgi:hypothetical protein